MFFLKSLVFAVLFVAFVAGNAEEEAPKKDDTSKDDASLSGTFKDLFNGLTTDQRQQVKDIIQNKDFTKQQIVDKIKEFAGGIGTETLQKFSAAIDQFQAKKAEETKDLQQKLEAMGNGGKEVAEKVSKIAQDMSLTFQQEQQQLKEAMASVSDEIKAKVEGTDLIKDMKEMKQKIETKIKSD